MHFEEQVTEFELELRSDPVSLAMTRDGQGCLVLDASGHIPVSYTHLTLQTKA